MVVGYKWFGLVCMSLQGGYATVTVAYHVPNP
jgi:hypothetical protein